MTIGPCGKGVRVCCIASSHEHVILLWRLRLPPFLVVLVVLVVVPKGSLVALLSPQDITKNVYDTKALFLTDLSNFPQKSPWVVCTLLERAFVCFGLV